MRTPLFEFWTNINRDLHRAAKWAGLAPVS